MIADARFCSRHTCCIQYSVVGRLVVQDAAIGDRYVSLELDLGISF